MSELARFDLSVILPFADDEETIGSVIHETASFLRERGVAFELIAVDEDSGDNSHAVLAMMRPEFAELRVITAPTRGRGVETGVARAVGQTIAVIGPHVTRVQLDAMLRANAQITAGATDLEFVIGQFIVAHRVRSLDAFHGVRIAGDATQRRLAKRLAERGLRVHVNGAALTRTAPRASWRDAFIARRAS